MRFTIALVLCLGVAHADPTFNYNELAPILKSLNVPTWMPSDTRRLQDEAPTLPAACTEACSGAQAFMTDAMAMGKNMEGMGSEPSPENIKTMMTEIFDLLCKHNDAVKCIAKEATKCGVLLGSRRLQMDGSNPFTAFSGMADCFCKLCPEAKTALQEFMTVYTEILTSMATGQEPSEAKKTEMLNGVCPLLAASKCITDNPTECKEMTAMATGLTVLEPNCTASGQITPAAKIEVELTFEALDYDKLDDEAKSGLTALIQMNFIKNLPTGYTAGHIKVTFSKGSVKAKVEITPLMSSSSDDLKAKVTAAKDKVSTAVATEVAASSTIDKYLETGKTKADIKGTAAAPKTGATGAQAGGADKAGASVFLAMLGLVVGTATM